MFTTELRLKGTVHTGLLPLLTLSKLRVVVLVTPLAVIVWADPFKARVRLAPLLIR